MLIRNHIMAKFMDFRHIFAFIFSLHVVVVHGANPTTTFTVCGKAPYPEICTYLIGKTSIQTPLDVRQATLLSSLAQAKHAHKFLLATNVSSFESRAKSAWANCLEFYDDTIYHLNRSVGSTNSHDIQTWLSMASTNHETCLDGFRDSHLSSHLRTLKTSLRGFSKYLRNSLAINKALTPLLTSSKKLKARRLMKTSDFPNWLSKRDRKLLASPVGAIRANLVVAQDGSGHHKTISEAIAAAPKGGSSRFVIHVTAGVYEENVDIKRSIHNLMLVGDGIGVTIVTGNKNYDDGDTTYDSATFGVSGAGFIARDMTFENTAGAGKHQAVAFRSGSDKSVLFGCSFVGNQDTIYAYAGRQLYRNCQVYGTIDFIFGDAAAVFQSCNIIARKAYGGVPNVITAQGRTDPNENTGIVIHNSAITGASDTFLGRPWKKFSRTVIMKCSLDRNIDSKGWQPWDGGFALSTLYYGEYMNTGPGAGTAGRVKWPGYHVITTPTEAMKFTVGDFLDGASWIPGTGLPYTSGL